MRGTLDLNVLSMAQFLRIEHIHHQKSLLMENIMEAVSGIGGMINNIQSAIGSAVSNFQNNLVIPSGQNDSLASAAQLAVTGTPLQQGQALRMLDQATGTRAAANTLTDGAQSSTTKTAAKAKTPHPETCTVEVRYTPVAGGLANHAFILTQDSDSTRYFRGGPASRDGGLNSGSSNSGSSDGTESSRGNPNNGIYGTIVTEYGLYRPRTIDWTTAPTGQQVVAIRPGNCDALDTEFARHADNIERANINYGPLAANSNSTAREILERAGFGNVQPVVWAPSWGIQLPEAR